MVRSRVRPTWIADTFAPSSAALPEHVLQLVRGLCREAGRGNGARARRAARAAAARHRGPRSRRRPRRLGARTARGRPRRTPCRRPTTRYGGVALRTQHRVGRARARAAGGRSARSYGSGSSSCLDLLGEVARDDDDPLAAGGGELVHERHDDGRPSIGRIGFGQCSVSGRRRVPSPAAITTASMCEQPFDLVEDRGGDRGLRRLRHRPVALARDRARPRCRRCRSRCRARPTSLKTTRSAFFVSSIARLRSSPSVAVLGAERDEHLARRACARRAPARCRRSARARASSPCSSFGRLPASASAGR